MASIFKRSKKKNEPYWIQYKDHLGKWKTAKGFTDKGLTEQLAVKLETEARLRKTGLVDAEQERIAEVIQALESFCKWCVLTKRLLSSPLVGLKKLNIEVDIRHERRALTPAE